jgi:hypothetical protein
MSILLIQSLFLKISLAFLVSVGLLAPSIAMEASEQEAIKTPLVLFHESSKYLVHIGFPDGLPEDAIMRPGRYDAANYFSLNGTLPSNDHMPRLDTTPYVVILKLTDVMMKRIVGFHVTEVLLAGEIDLKKEECWIIASQGSKIPEALRDKIVYYEGEGLVNRNQKTREYLESLGAYPICMEEKVIYGQRTWDNSTIANTTINGENINVNLNGSSDYFNNILQHLPNISYTCPGNDRDYADTPSRWTASGIGHLGILKGEITQNNQKGIAYHQTELINWVGTLRYLEGVAKSDFISRIQKLPESSNWISSTINDVGETINENCVIS